MSSKSPMDILDELIEEALNLSEVGQIIANVCAEIAFESEKWRDSIDGSTITTQLQLHRIGMHLKGIREAMREVATASGF